MPWTKHLLNHGAYSWENPKWAAYDKKHSLLKIEKMILANEVLKWLQASLTFLAEENWIFTVDGKGEYLPATLKSGVNGANELAWEKIDTVLNQHFFIKLRKPKNEFYRKHDLDWEREKLHKVTTVVLINLLGTAKTNQMLTDIRTSYKLKKLTSKDLENLW
jgi:hypothetical protein